MPLEGFFRNGSTEIPIGGPPIQLLADSEPEPNGLAGGQAAAGVLVLAPLTNGRWQGKVRHEVTIYIAGQPNRATPQDGYPLEPGRSLWMPITFPHRVWAYSVLTGDAEGLTSQLRWIWH